MFKLVNPLGHPLTGRAPRSSCLLGAPPVCAGGIYLPGLVQTWPQGLVVLGTEERNKTPFLPFTRGGTEVPRGGAGLALHLLALPVPGWPPLRLRTRELLACEPRVRLGATSPMSSLATSSAHPPAAGGQRAHASAPWRLEGSRDEFRPCIVSKSDVCQSSH